MAEQAGNIESRVAALEARVASLEATHGTGPAPQQGAAPVPTHVVYYYGIPPCAAALPPCAVAHPYMPMPPCACGFASHSVQQDDQAAPTPADFSKLGE